MRYIVRHHSGTLWFQIRVPVALTPRFGPIIRQCLGTGDLSEARSLALQLAGDWLSRFSAARQGIELPQVAQASTADDPAACSRAQEYKSVHIGAPGVASTANPPIFVAQTQDAALAHPKTRADDFAKLFAAWKRANPDRASSTVIEVKRVLHLFERFVRKHPSDVQRADIAAWRDRLIASSQARASVAKKIGFISTILQVGYDAGQLTQNVARGLKIPKAHVDPLVRRPFTADELTRLFSSHVYSKKARPRAGGGAAAAWLPVLALATGCRLEELAQLRIEDVIYDQDYGWYLRVCDLHAEQRIKTTSSRRLVPLHRELEPAGFLRYLDMISDGNGWLWPELDPDHDGRRGGNFGKWFARYLRSSRGAGISDPCVVFHAFRHLFKTLCREAEITEEVHDALTGHAATSVGRGYGAMPLRTLRSAMDRIRFPVRLPVIQD